MKSGDILSIPHYFIYIAILRNATPPRMGAVYNFVIIFSYAIFEMVWTEKVHTFLFCPARVGEIMVVKSPLCVQKAAKEKNRIQRSCLLTFYLYIGAGDEVRYEL